MERVKILVSGASQCGKSSYIQFLDDRAINVVSRTRSGLNATVGMDFGVRKVNGFQVSLFGTPGLLRFSIIRKILAEGADGVIFIFDSSNPVTDEAGITILNEIRWVLPIGIPIVYLANKYDLPDARDPDIIRDQNYIPSKLKFFPTSTVSGLNIVESLDYLVKEEILERWKELIISLTKYETDLPGLAAELEKDTKRINGFLYLLEVKGLITFNKKDLTYRVRKEVKEFI